MYLPEYTNSWALVIGINNYQYTSPLSYARHDAEAVANILEKQFNFPQNNIVLKVDEAATRDAILKSFLQFANGEVETNDRILVFFAGHGYTHRKEGRGWLSRSR